MTGARFSDTLENQLIKEAYAATLDPARLSNFEQYWQSYIDAKISENPENSNLDDLPVNMHITTALDILERIRLVNEKEQSQFLEIEELLGKPVMKAKIPAHMGTVPEYKPRKPRRGRGQKRPFRSKSRR